MIRAAQRGFVDSIRAAVRGSGMSLYDLAGRCEVDRAALSRFARGKAGLSIEALDRLANALGLVVVVRGE